MKLVNMKNVVYLTCIVCFMQYSLILANPMESSCIPSQNSGFYMSNITRSPCGSGACQLGQGRYLIEWPWLGHLAERMGATAIAWHDTVKGFQKAATFMALIRG